MHIWTRARQEEHEAFEGEDCVFLTVRWMQRLLRAVGARKTGEKAAASAIAFLEQRSLIVDTGKTKKPRRSSERIARAEKFQPAGPAEGEGGKEAQATPCARTGGVCLRSPVLRESSPQFPRAPTGVLRASRST